MEYIIYCDESNSSGPKCSDFFGGCIVKSRDWHAISGTLEAKKKELNLFGELKWTKVTAQYLERYIEKPAGSRYRGKRTIAKEKLYKHINKRICEILPHFNIGISTGARNYQNPAWELPYSHWKFVPR